MQVQVAPKLVKQEDVRVTLRGETLIIMIASMMFGNAFSTVINDLTGSWDSWVRFVVLTSAAVGVVVFHEIILMYAEPIVALVPFIGKRVSKVDLQLLNIDVLQVSNNSNDKDKGGTNANVLRQRHKTEPDTASSADNESHIITITPPSHSAPTSSSTPVKQVSRASAMARFNGYGRPATLVRDDGSQPALFGVVGPQGMIS